MPLVLDTSFLIDLAREEEGARRLFEEIVRGGDPMMLPTVVLAEFLGGSPQPERDRAQIEEAAQVLPLTLDDAMEAAAVARETFRDGRFPGWTDCFVAGFARSRGDLPIVTGNPRHFPRSETIRY